MSYTRHYLGDASGLSPAGEIGGVALLLHDIRELGSRANSFIKPGFSYSQSRFDSMMAEFRKRPGESDSAAGARVRARYAQLSGDQVVTLVIGTTKEIASAIVVAKGLAAVRVNAAGRALNHARQSSVIEPARQTWQGLSELVSNMEANRAAAPAASGLGEPISVGAIIAIAVVGVIVSLSVVAGLVYVADMVYRTRHATDEARRLCRDAGGCTPQEQANIAATLRTGPMDAFLRGAGEAAGKALSEAAIGVAIAGGSAVVIGGGLLWYFKLGGDDWIRRKFGRG